MSRGRVPVATCVRIVANAFAVSEADIKSRSRVRPLVIPRHVAMYIAHAEGHSLEAVGSYLGGRDHTTVLNGIRRTESEWLNDQRVREKYNNAMAEVIAKRAGEIALADRAQKVVQRLTRGPLSPLLIGQVEALLGITPPQNASEDAGRPYGEAV